MTAFSQPLNDCLPTESHCGNEYAADISGCPSRSISSFLFFNSYFIPICTLCHPPHMPQRTLSSLRLFWAKGDHILLVICWEPGWRPSSLLGECLVVPSIYPPRYWGGSMEAVAISLPENMGMARAKRTAENGVGMTGSSLTWNPLSFWTSVVWANEFTAILLGLSSVVHAILIGTSFCKCTLLGDPQQPYENLALGPACLL